MAGVLAIERESRHAHFPGCVFWVLFAGERLLTRPLTLRLEEDRKALALFSHEEEAEMFIWSFGTAEDGWHARATSAGEVVSLLYGPCCSVTHVALDPLPEMLTDGLLGLVTLGRAVFVKWVMDRGRGPTPRDVGRGDGGEGYAPSPLLAGHRGG
jgi:hypothetical protein